MPTDSPPAPATPALWFFWHPHQKLWNWSLVAWLEKWVPTRLGRRIAVRVIVLIDSAVLALRALLRRLMILGPARLLGLPALPDAARIIYLDIGTHREGYEMEHVLDRVLPGFCPRVAAYGFEAGGASYRRAAAKFAARPGVTVLHMALCHHKPASGTIRLYHSTGSLGDSLYRPTDSFEDVPAVRLSEWIAQQRLDLPRCIAILRMNIEAAEFDVIRDLVESGQHQHIDGYFGMWDDVSKVDPRNDAPFRELLRRHGIHPLTFNGRDFASKLRLFAIRYDMRTHIYRGWLRKRPFLEQSTNA